MGSIEKDHPSCKQSRLGNFSLSHTFLGYFGEPGLKCVEHGRLFILIYVTDTSEIFLKLKFQEAFK